MIKRSIPQEDITLKNTYAPNVRATKCLEQILMSIKADIGSNTDIVGDFTLH